MLHDDTGDLSVGERTAQLARKFLAGDGARLQPVVNSALPEISLQNRWPKAAKNVGMIALQPLPFHVRFLMRAD